MTGDIKRSLLKDIKTEFRNPAALGAAAAFACITTLTVSIAAGGVPFSPAVKSILLWVILFFCAMNSLLHVFTREQEEGTALFLILNVSTDAVFISKLAFNAALFFLIEFIVCPLFMLFMQLAPAHFLFFCLTVICGGAAIVSASTMLAAMTSKAGGKASLFTVIAFPLILPVLWVAISTTVACLDSASTPAVGNIIFLLAFSVAIAAMSLLLFKFVWTETNIG